MSLKFKIQLKFNNYMELLNIHLKILYNYTCYSFYQRLIKFINLTIFLFILINS